VALFTARVGTCRRGGFGWLGGGSPSTQKARHNGHPAHDATRQESSSLFASQRKSYSE